MIISYNLLMTRNYLPLLLILLTCYIPRKLGFRKESSMLIVNLKALMERKSAIDRKRITYKVIEQETGIKVLTLSRIATNPNYNISRGDIEKLLIYFNCQPNDLFGLIPES